MTTRRFLLLLTTAMIAIVGAMYLSSLRHLERDPRGGPILPGLEAELDSITDIRLRKGGPGGIVSLHRIQPGKWAVAERGGYPADASKVRKLLLQLSDAKIVEEKTANPANYSILGVEDPTDGSTAGAEISVITPANKRVLIVGKMTGGTSYARRGGNPASFAVEPPITIETGAREWIDAALLNIDAAKIQSIHVALAAGGAYSISRKSAGDFALDPVPRGREADDAATIAPSPGSFNGVTADDVAPVAEIDFSKPSSCEIQLFDGSSYKLSGVVLSDKHWITVTASKNDALAARTRDRAFELAGFRYDALFRPIEKLLKPQAKKPAVSPAKSP